jgi:hypothetical protein
MAKTRIGANAIFSGPQKGLSIIGSRCYAFTGAVSASDSLQTLFDFNTGKGFIIATLTMTATIRMVSGDVGSGYVRGWQLDYNGQTVGLYKADSASAGDNLPTVETEILIPPLTNVVLTCVDSASTVNWKGTANITGRVYDA